MNESLNFIKNMAIEGSAPLSLSYLILNLILGSIISFFLKLHYIKFGSTLTNRDQFSNMFPFIILTTTLVIAIVKSSLALSLGLVGALSIVRFRTPIKEPEELAYLFLSIAVGLGLGANQTLPTIVSLVVILVVLTFYKKRNYKNKEKNMFVTLETNLKDDNEKNLFIEKVNRIFETQSIEYDLRRLDYSDNLINFTCVVNFKNITSLQQLISELNKEYPGININYIDQNQIPSI